MWTIGQPIVQTTEDISTPLNHRITGIPQPGRRRRSMTAPRTPRDKGSKTKRVLLTLLTVLVLLGILATAGYFIKRLIDSKYFFCKKSVKFIPLEAACDGKNDCSGGEDEITCVSSFTDSTTFPVRLMASRSVLQVYSPGSGWRSVCSDSWTQQHMLMACQQLGYTNKPSSTHVPVNTLTSSIKNGPFTAVRPGTENKPIHLSTIDLKECRSGNVVSLSCSDCGKVGDQGRIVGGTSALIKDWPWQVSLQQGGQHTCGGSLLSPSWIVTAAHCFSGTKKDLSRWRVVSGQTNMGSLGGSYVDRVIKNGQYNANSNDYDIALVRLSRPIRVGDSQRPVCLPPTGFQLPAKASMTVTGWGYMREDGSVSASLQQATLPLIDWDKCSNPAVYGSSVTKRMLCAGFLEGKVDACQGDSGGPLVYYSSYEWNLMGVVSWGVGCARPGRPGVYSNVGELLNWIYTVIEKNP